MKSPPGHGMQAMENRAHTKGHVYTTIKSASKDRVVMEILSGSGHVTLLVIPVVQFFLTPLGGVVRFYWTPLGGVVRFYWSPD